MRMGGHLQAICIVLRGSKCGARLCIPMLLYIEIDNALGRAMQHAMTRQNMADLHSVETGNQHDNAGGRPDPSTTWEVVRPPECAHARVGAVVATIVGVPLLCTKHSLRSLRKASVSRPTYANGNVYLKCACRRKHNAQYHAIKTALSAVHHESSSIEQAM